MKPKELFEKTKESRKSLVKAMPEVMNAVSDGNKKALQEGALTAKTKEFISLGMSIMIMCDECVLHHTISLVGLGTSREEFVECLETAVALQSCPGMKYSQLALEYFDELNE